MKKQFKNVCARCGAVRMLNYKYPPDAMCHTCANIERCEAKAKQVEEYKKLGSKLPDKHILEQMKPYLAPLNTNSHEATILNALPEHLIPYWFGIPHSEDRGGKNYRLKGIVNDTLVYCKTCDALTDGHKYCSHSCYIERNTKKLSKLKSQYEQFVERHKVDEPYTFTEEEITQYKQLIPSIKCPYSEAVVVKKLYKHDKQLAIKYINLFAALPKGRHMLASGQLPEQQCLTCGTKIRLSYIDDCGEDLVRFCCSKCAAVSHVTKKVREATMYERHGVKHVAQKQEFHSKQQASAFKVKYVTFGDRTFVLQGFEGLVLPSILDKLSIGVGDIEQGSYIKPIEFYYKGKDKVYFPDFYVPKLNLVIEVKSDWTLCGNEYFFSTNVLKRKACIAAGYKFQMCLSDRKGNILNTTNWHNYSYETARAKYYEKNRNASI